MSKKLSCTNCRKIKRKCDGNEPCSSCIRRKTHCEFNQEDRRHQRFSTGYVKSLETNMQFLEGMLAHLVKVRNDPVSVAAKLESLASTYQETSELFAADPKIQPRKNDPNSSPLIASKNQYFGPGSIWHYRNPDSAPLMELETNDPNSDSGDSDSDSAIISENSPQEGHQLSRKVSSDSPVTIEEDYEYVSKLACGFLKDSHPSSCSLMFDIKNMLALIKQRNFSAPCLNKPLFYAMCAMSQRITTRESQQYFKLSLKMILHKHRFNSSLANSQCYTLLGLHAFSVGEASRGWNLLALGRSVGSDVGFEHADAQQEDLRPAFNRVFIASLLLEAYFALAVGRRTTMIRGSTPVLKLPTETNEDYLNIKYTVDLVEFSKHMLSSTYESIQFHEDSNINYLVKFNRAKKYNIRVLQWKQNLDPQCDWSYKSMKNDDNLASRNHSLKLAFYYIILFLNKPFYHVPKKYSTVFLIEEMANELSLIIQSYLRKMEKEQNIIIPTIPSFTVHNEDELFTLSTMELCVVAVLCHVLVSLIISQPDHYSYLGKHFKLFAIYLSFCTPRKYSTPINPIQVLWEKYENFKRAENTFQNYGNLNVGRSKENKRNEIRHVKLDSGDLTTSNRPTSESGSSEDLKVSPRTLSDTESRSFMPSISDSMIADPDTPTNFSRFLNDNKLSGMYSPGQDFNLNVPAMDQKSSGMTDINGYDFPNPFSQGATTVPNEQPNMLQPPAKPHAPMYYTDNSGDIDPLGQLFSHGGSEFDVPYPTVDWDSLFQNQYPNINPI